MVSETVLNRVRTGICAVGYLTVPPEQYAKDPTKPFFKVVGTGFLVRDATVITNRHVIKELINRRQDTGFPEKHQVLQFVYPRGEGQWATHFEAFTFYGIVTNPDYDVGLIEFNRTADPHFDQCRPLELGDTSSIQVGQAIAAATHMAPRCFNPFGAERSIVSVLFFSKDTFRRLLRMMAQT